MPGATLLQCQARGNFSDLDLFNLFDLLKVCASLRTLVEIGANGGFVRGAVIHLVLGCCRAAYDRIVRKAEPV